MNLKAISLREAIDAVIEEETVYMLVRMESDTMVSDLYGADGYVIIKQDPVRIDHGKIVALYKAKWSIKKISDEIGCSQQTVINHLKKAGVYNVQEAD